MANIHAVIEEVAKLNPALAREIQKYVKTHSYGLVYENNLPDAVRLYKKLPGVGDNVNILSKRGHEETDVNKVVWTVKEIKDGVAIIQNSDEFYEVPVEDIVPIVGYRDVIYPGLKEVDRVENGKPEDPYHMVINSENYHALEALTYAYAGKVDCIYIDPPYNSGATDWKYNNDYVDENDKYRHSKWLTFMERRLKLAAQLLNPNNSVLIVTIDEKEYARLGLLLEQIFPEAKIQMISSIISRKGTARADEFSRTNEFIYCVRFGNCSIEKLNDVKSVSKDSEVHWQPLRRSDLASKRGTKKGGTAQFYPIYIDSKEGKIVHIGEPLMPSDSLDSIPMIEGTIPVFPIRDNGIEMNWGLTGGALKARLEKGFVRVGKYFKDKPQKYVISYLTTGTIEDIEKGEATVTGYAKDGSVNAFYSTGKKSLPTTQWDNVAYDAKIYGTNVNSCFMPDRIFPFPKSVYAVEDVIRLFVTNKPDALIVDFFAGSGTTANAVMLLNHLDGGNRRSISITNNEIGADEERTFIQKGLQPYDAEWMEYGIANYFTWPRIKSAITGINTLNEPVKGDYKFTEEFPMSDGFKENAIFCELTYESAWPIRLDNAFDAIAPILWMQAGCRGPIIRKIGKSYLTTDYYGVLFDYNQASKFCEKIKNTPSIKTVFVVTDDQRRYSNMCKRLPGVEVHRLYETYLRTFEIYGEGGID
ncbi:DNA methyltransferase [Clostridioides sp. ES-S-0190-01]|uniref:site-specific DNA-methyltransferase n=1 Tax=Clostridioides sp. ES-S-0190-01 TaxID=2770787 RepID=UPI001D114EBC|nr:site-specific DNA-methyltransferase [Clostridioides sp. ES-S-0190-01]